MSQIQDEKALESCKFCGKTFPSKDLDIHIDNHIKDSNTPAVLLINDKYVPQFLNDYSSYTLYGKSVMFKKFMDIEFPSYDFCTNFIGNDKNNYEQVRRSFNEMKLQYYNTMSNNEAEFLNRKSTLFTWENNSLNRMNKIWDFMGSYTYTKNQYEIILSALRST